MINKILAALIIVVILFFVYANWDMVKKKYDESDTLGLGSLLASGIVLAGASYRLANCPEVVSLPATQ
jgi:hypothetical protein